MRKLDIEMYTSLFLRVKSRMDLGIAKHCLSTNIIENAREGEMSTTQMAYNVSSSFAAGINTVSDIRLSPVELK